MRKKEEEEEEQNEKKKNKKKKNKYKIEEGKFIENRIACKKSHTRNGAAVFQGPPLPRP